MRHTLIISVVALIVLILCTLILIVAVEPRSNRVMLVFRQFPGAKVDSLIPMTEIGFEVRQEKGLKAQDGEYYTCQHQAEPFTLLDTEGEVATQAKRIRLVCNDGAEFVIVGIVF